MKKGLLTLLLPVLLLGFFCVPNTGYCEARGKKASDQKTWYQSKESFENFSRKLNLTKDQQEKIRPILNEEVDRIKEVYNKARDQERQIQEEHQTRVMEVLTPQQQVQYRKMIEERKKKQKTEEVYVPIVITVVVAEPQTYYGKSVIAEGYVKKVLTKNAFVLSEAPQGQAEIIVVGAGPAVVQTPSPKVGDKVAVRGVVQNFRIDTMEKALGVRLDRGVFGILENKPGIFARWVKKLE